MIKEFTSVFLLAFALFLTPEWAFAQAGGIIGANTPVNYAPVADPQDVTILATTPMTITLTGEDANGDPLTFGIVAAPSHGSLSGFNAATGAVIYTPAAGFTGSDSFTFKVNDGIVDSDPATVNITMGSTCSYALSPPSQVSFPASGGSGSVGVTVATGCTWTASSDQGWLTITGGSPGNGNGIVTFSMAANSSTSQRQATLTVAGQPFTVTQAGTACSYALTAAGQSFGASGGSGSVGVVAPGGCAWTASSSDPSWLTVTSGSSGSGSGTVLFSVAANPGTSQRQATITVQGQLFTVAQVGINAQLPDLVPTISPIPSVGTIGDPIQISASVLNQGSGAAGAFRLGFYFSADAAITTGDLLFAFCDFPGGLAAGASSGCSGPVHIPTSLSPGTYFVGVIADYQNVVVESTEGNNAAVTGPITVNGPRNVPGIGVFRNGNWFLDLNGNGVWDGCGIDGCIFGWGAPGDLPVAGRF